MKIRQLELELEILKLKKKHNIKDDPDLEIKKDDLEILNNDNKKEIVDEEEIEDILSKYFKHTGKHNDVLLNSVVDKFSYYLNISKRRIINYLRSIGGKKYKSGSIQGNREIKQIKVI